MTESNLSTMTVSALEQMVNTLEESKQKIRATQKNVQDELSQRTTSQKYKTMLSSMSPADLQGLSQFISDAGKIDASKVGVPGK